MRDISQKYAVIFGMILAIVGSRAYSNYYEFSETIDQWISYYGQPLEIVSGGAQGADSLAKKYALDRGITFREFLPDWKSYGKRAGPLRNQKIVDASTHMVAFLAKSSKGTVDSINKARNRRLKISVYFV